jgi:hypothetical protein
MPSLKKITEEDSADRTKEVAAMIKLKVLYSLVIYMGKHTHIQTPMQQVLKLQHSLTHGIPLLFR